MKNLVKDLSKKDETRLSYDTFFSLLTEDEKKYHRANEAYKQYISQYSQEYIEMSEYYYGQELPYDVYCREFKKKVALSNYNGWFGPCSTPGIHACHGC